MALVHALWVGTPCRLDKPGHPQDGTDLVADETVIRGVPEPECAASANWQVIPLEDLTKDDLVELAAIARVDVADATTKPKLIKALVDADEEPEPDEQADVDGDEPEATDSEGDNGSDTEGEDA